MRRDEPNRTPDGHPEYGNNVVVTANALTSDDDDIAEILNLPPLKVKPELKTADDMNIDVADEDEEMDNSCEVVNTITEMDMVQDDETTEEVKISIEQDQIITRRPINKEEPNQGVLCETINVGTTITCRTCCGTEIEGEVLAFDTHTRTVIIKPAPNLDKPLRNGKHMVNIDHVVDIRIMRVCTSKPPEPTAVNMKEGFRKNKLVMTMEARDISTNEDMFQEKEHWSWDDEEALVKMNESTEHNAHFRGKWKQNTNGKYDKPRCTKRQNQESVLDNITKTMKKGEIAPMVPTDSKKQKTQHNLLAVYENIDRGDVYDETYREHGNYTKNGLKSAIQYQIQDYRPSADAQDLHKDEEITFDMEGEEGHN
jgi:hypothetical protein